MPIDGIPNVLENILMSVLSSHDLKSWNVFNEQNGSVSLRIRFMPSCTEVISQESSIKAFSYKRKSQSQLNRDRGTYPPDRDNDRARRRRNLDKSVQVQQANNDVVTASIVSHSEDLPSKGKETINAPAKVVKVDQATNSEDCVINSFEPQETMVCEPVSFIEPNHQEFGETNNLDSSSDSADWSFDLDNIDYESLKKHSTPRKGNNDHRLGHINKTYNDL